MSGIAGLLRFDGGTVARRDLERMANALRAHGPDRSDVWVQGAVGFAHTLMRFTPEDYLDHQPYRGGSGACITADLRLDNRAELTALLGNAADDARDWSDAQLLLHLWEELGDSLWPRLRGPFAAAIWSPREGVLHLARDHLGFNVVTYHRARNLFAFATLPKGLFALPNVPRAVNKQKLADFLVLNHAEVHTTPYEQVFRVEPASLLKVRLDGSVATTRFWSPQDIAQVRLPHDADYADALREKLDVAVRRQLRSIHPVGCFLSGGLDSPAVAVLAARALAETGRRLTSYTEVPRADFAWKAVPGSYPDETPYVEELAKAVPNLDVIYVQNRDCDDLADLEAFFAAQDGPVRNVTNLGWILGTAKAARGAGHRVLLTGEHGNYGMSWSGWSQSIDHLLAGRIGTAAKQFRIYRARYAASTWRSFLTLFINPLLPDGIGKRSHRRRYPDSVAPWNSYSAIRPDFADRMGIEARAKRHSHDFLYRTRPGERLTSLAPIDYYGDWVAAIKAHSGVETRDPTADLDVLSFCLGVPPEQYLAEGIDRSLVRRAMWGLVPRSILLNERKGLQSADWHEKWSENPRALSDMLDAFAQSPLVRESLDLHRLRQLLNSWPTTGWDDERVAWEYQRAFTRAIGAGRFLLWFEAANRPTSSDARAETAGRSPLRRANR